MIQKIFLNDNSNISIFLKAMKRSNTDINQISTRLQSLLVTAPYLKTGDPAIMRISL